MSVSYDITGTLRSQEHGHQPLVLVYDARGNGGVHYARPLQETTKTGSRTTQHWW